MRSKAITPSTTVQMQSPFRVLPLHAFALLSLQLLFCCVCWSMQILVRLHIRGWDLEKWRLLTPDQAAVRTHGCSPAWVLIFLCAISLTCLCSHSVRRGKELLSLLFDVPRDDQAQVVLQHESEWTAGGLLKSEPNFQPNQRWVTRLWGTPIYFSHL